MTDIDLSTLVLDWVSTYGSPMVALILMIGALGIPLPTTLLVIASGAFMRQDLLDLYTTPILGLTGTVTGDILLFSVGRLASRGVENRFGKTGAWQKAHQLFETKGGAAIFLTRWLLTAVAFPVTLIAGSSRYRFSRFFLFAFSGELLWVVLYGGLGYLFGSQWELISDFLSNFSGFLLGFVVVAAGIYLLLRMNPKKNGTPLPDSIEKETS